MGCIFLFLCLTKAIDLYKSGYFLIESDTKIILNFDEANIAAVFIISNNPTRLRIKVSNDDQSQNISVFTGNSIILQGNTAEIENLDRNQFSLAIWIVPYSICPKSAIYYYSKTGISYHLVLNDPKNSFCMFGLSNSSFVSTISVTPNLESTLVSYYQQGALTDTMEPYKCRSYCDFSRKTPFFISIVPTKSIHTEIDLTFTGTMYEQVGSDCKAEVMNYLTPETFSVSYPGGTPTNIKCGQEKSSQMSQFSHGFIYISLFAIVMGMGYIIINGNVILLVQQPQKNDEGYLIQRIENEPEIETIVEKAKQASISSSIVGIPKFL